MRPLDPRLLRHASAARTFVALTAALAVATAGLVLVQADLLARGIDRAFLGGAGLDELTPLLIGLLAVVVGRAGLTWAGEVAAHRAAADVIRQLRSRLVAHTLRLGPRHRGLPPTGELATLSTRGLDGLDGYFSRYLPTLLVAAVVPAVVAARILMADWVSGLVVGLTVPLIPIFMILIGLHTEHSTRRQWRTLAVLGHHFLDLVAGLDVLVAFGRAGRQSGRLRTLAEDYRRATMRTLRVAFLSALALELLASLSVALVAVAVGLRLVEGRLDLLTALVVLILVPEVYLPLRAVGARFHDSAEGLAAAAEVFAVLEIDVPGGGRAPAPDPSTLPVRLHGVVVDGRGGRVLDGLDLTLEPGTMIGIRGRSGAGKSTLLDLLLGLRPPDAGRITIGGTDLDHIDRDAWLSRVAWVPQRPVLLAGSVADNIRLGDPDADQARVILAARAAALDVPLDTVVGEDGAGLSTGQLRRVALARAVLADRGLLLLDEPTEGVDADTEASVLAALPAVAAGRTTVLVSHRPEVLAICDRIVDLAGLAAPVTTSTGARLARSGPPAREPGTAPDPDPDPPVLAVTAGAVAWTLAAARPQHSRLVLAVLLGSAALGCGVALTATSAWLISTAALHPPVLSLMVAIVAVRAFGLGKGVLRYAERLVAHDAALRAASALRERIWTALVRLGPASTTRLRRGDLLSRLVGDVDAQQDVLLRVVLPVTSAGVVGLAFSLGIGILLPAAGVTVALGLLAAGVGAPALAAWAAWRTERDTAAARGDVLARTVAMLDAAPDLIAFGAAGRYRQGLVDADNHLGALLRRAATARGLGGGVGVLAIGATSVAATAVGIVAVRAGVLPGPALAVLALTPLAAAEMVAGLPDTAVRLLTARPAVRRLAELEIRQSPVTESAVPSGITPPSTLATHDLCVRWPGAERDAVQHVNLELHGRAIALCGPSGSGKSTVVAALMRTLEPSGGRIVADGRDVHDLTGDELRRGLAWCGPDAHLFDSTLRANLALAAPDAGDDEITEALHRARLGAWLATLPDGLDTLVGEHGGTVSGGERQRIGVARALLADRPIMLFDEPTAHLDAATATALATELLASTAGRTALIVTHRPEQTPGLPLIQLGQGPDHPCRPVHPTPAISSRSRSRRNSETGASDGTGDPPLLEACGQGPFSGRESVRVEVER